MAAYYTEPHVVRKETVGCVERVKLRGPNVVWSVKQHSMAWSGVKNGTRITLPSPPG